VHQGVFVAENDVANSHGGAIAFEERTLQKLETACRRFAADSAQLFARQYEGDWQI
jgi:hypothetical protein